MKQQMLEEEVRNLKKTIEALTAERDQLYERWNDCQEKRMAAVASAEHQDWEKARARASSWNAGGVLEGLMLAIDTDGDAYVLPSNIEGNLVALPARDDNGEILNPEAWLAMVFRFNAYPALTAEVDRMLGVIEDQAKLLDAITK